MLQKPRKQTDYQKFGYWLATVFVLLIALCLIYISFT